MCGIVGYITGPDLPKKSPDRLLLPEYFTAALMLDTLRGMDSTGVVSINRRGEIATAKDVVSGIQFVTTPMYQKVPLGTFGMIGHNRAATRGHVTADNAHPFVEGPVTMVHNGTLSDMGRSLPNFCEKQNVDSMNICRGLAHVKPEDAHTVLAKINGAYALAWYDARDRSINIARNAERPLHISTNTDRTVVYFMSDGLQMEAIKKGLGYDVGAIYNLHPHTHLKWTTKSLVPEVKNYSPFVTPPRGASPPRVGAGQVPTTTTKKTATGTHGAPSGDTDDTTKLTVMVNGFRRAVPEVFWTEVGDCCDLDINANYFMTPKRWVPYMHPHGQYGMVIGDVWHDAWQCHIGVLIHNVGIEHSHKLLNRPWTVRFYGVTVDVLAADQPRYGFYVFGKVVDFRGEKPQDPERMRGPGYRQVGRQEWLKATQKGCSMCQTALWIKDEAVIEWIGSEKQNPICPTCAARTKGVANDN